jgi:hypothetical protein
VTRATIVCQKLRKYEKVCQCNVLANNANVLVCSTIFLLCSTEVFFSLVGGAGRVFVCIKVSPRTGLLMSKMSFHYVET